jgi:hypothetical protein
MKNIWVLPHAPWYKNVQVQKKTNQNGERLWALNFNKEEEEIPYPNPPPTTSQTYYVS